MVDWTMMLSRIALLVVLAAMPSIAHAQDQSQDDPSQGSGQGQDANQVPSTPQRPADPVAALQGLWRVDKIDGSAGNDSLMGRMFRIDSAAIASMTAGTCSNPGFTAAADPTDPNKQTVTVTCVGQTFATAAWDATDPDTVNWSEPNLQVVLHRVASAATLKPAADGGADSGGGNNNSNSDDNSNNSDDSGNSE
jgi:hypothetical protein